MNAIRELNPNVAIYLSSGNPNSKPDTFFTEFNAVVATDCPVDVLIKVNKICRDNSILFYCADTWGFYGYVFLDLQQHKHTRFVMPYFFKNFYLKKLYILIIPYL